MKTDHRSHLFVTSEEDDRRFVNQLSDFNRHFSFFDEFLEPKQMLGARRKHISEGLLLPLASEAYRI